MAKAKSNKAKAPRAKFALPENKAFPLNTSGRRQVAKKDAVASERAGNITPAQEKQVFNAVDKTKGKGKKNGKAS